MSCNSEQILASQNTASAIAAFSNRKLNIATLTAGSAENRRKSRNEIANRCVSKSQIPNRNVFCLWNSKDKSKVPKLSDRKNRCDFRGAQFQIAAFPCFRNRSVFGTLRNGFLTQNPRERRVFFSKSYVQNKKIIHSRLGNPLDIYRALSGPPAPEPRENLKKVSRGLRPGAPRESGKSFEKVFSGPFRDFFQTLDTFFRGGQTCNN